MSFLVRTDPRHFDSMRTSLDTSRGLWPAIGRSPSFLPIGGCAGCIRLRSPPFPLGCRTPYPGACAAAHPLWLGRSTTILSIVAARSLRSSTFARRSPPQRSTVAIGHHALFGALFSSVGGILARLPPKRALPSIASAGCHSHCTPPSSSHSATKTAQIRSKIPAAAQRWNQSWTVLLGPTARAVGPTGSRCASGR